jgi:hypothetical protein
MKAKYNNKTVYVKHVSDDNEYAIVTYDKSKLIGLFKVNLPDLSELNIKKLK